MNSTGKSILEQSKALPQPTRLPGLSPYIRFFITTLTRQRIQNRNFLPYSSPSAPPPGVIHPHHSAVLQKTENLTTRMIANPFSSMLYIFSSLILKSANTFSESANHLCNHSGDAALIQAALIEQGRTLASSGTGLIVESVDRNEKDSLIERTTTYLNRELGYFAS